MPITLESLRSMKPAITSLADEYGVKNIRVFGSIIHGSNIESSDIDLLVDMIEGKDLWDMAGFKTDVEELLQHKVDVVPAKNLHWYIKDKILAEASEL